MRKYKRQARKLSEQLLLTRSGSAIAESPIVDIQMTPLSAEQAADWVRDGLSNAYKSCFFCGKETLIFGMSVGDEDLEPDGLQVTDCPLSSSPLFAHIDCYGAWLETLPES